MMKKIKNFIITIIERIIIFKKIKIDLEFGGILPIIYGLLIFFVFFAIFVKLYLYDTGIIVIINTELPKPELPKPIVDVIPRRKIHSSELSTSDKVMVWGIFVGIVIFVGIAWWYGIDLSRPVVDL